MSEQEWVGVTHEFNWSVEWVERVRWAWEILRHGSLCGQLSIKFKGTDTVYLDDTRLVVGGAEMMRSISQAAWAERWDDGE